MLETSQAILVVEDSPEDYELTVRAFDRAGFKNPLYRCSDGDDALDFLHQRGVYADPGSAPRPGVILLDLNLPGVDGRAVLQELKADQSLKKIPIIVLTTSKDDRDVQQCYDFGANSYVQKPVTLEGFYMAIQRMSEFWFAVAVLPTGAG